ncbi:MAG: GFA family protein [Pseudomonadota bacterium]
MTETFSGRCLCGAVRFSIDGLYQGPVACHCRECQRHSGSFWVAVTAERESVTITSDRLAWVSVSPTAWREFCRDCGGYLFWQPVMGETIDIALGAMDFAPAEAPALAAHIHVAEALLPVPEDGVPRFDGALPEE